MTATTTHGISNSIKSSANSKGQPLDKQRKKAWLYIVLAVLVLIAIAADEVIDPWETVSRGNIAEQYLANGQVPPMVDLPIQNLPQETEVWCWVAVSQQIIMATQGYARTPSQCSLVGYANGVGPQACCQNRAACTRPGTLEEIQGLIQQFGGRSSSLAAPTDPKSLYQTLANGHAIIISIQATPYMGHVVVLRGMAWQPGPNGLEPVLLINDPMSHFTQPIPFRNIAQYWSAAIVVS